MKELYEELQQHFIFEIELKIKKVSHVRHVSIFKKNSNNPILTMSYDRGIIKMSVRKKTSYDVVLVCSKLIHRYLRGISHV